MKKCLIFITAGFPYGTVEPFIESELPYHTDFFDKVYVFALDAGGNATRQLPPGVECFNVSPPDKRFSRLNDILRAATFRSRIADENTSDRDETSGSLTKKLFRRYFEARSIRHIGEILRVSENIDFSAFDKIVIFSYWFFVTAMTGALLQQHLKKSCDNTLLVSRGHGYDVYSYANTLNYLPDRNFLFSAVYRLYVCSEHGKNYLSGNYPAWREKIAVSYLGTPDRGLGPVPDDGVFRIVTCSRVVPLKRLERLVDTLLLLKISGLKLSWTHIGGGAGLTKLEKRAEKLKDFMSVSFEGERSNKSVLELYQSRPFSLFINVSSSEGLPVSIMEAASFGIPAVATDVGGTREIVCDGLTGTLIPADFSYASLADEIRRFAFMPIMEYIDYRLNTRKHWEEKFSADNNYKKFSAEISGG